MVEPAEFHFRGLWRAAVRGFGSLSDWILTAALRHPDAKLLRELAGADSSIVLPAIGVTRENPVGR